MTFVFGLADGPLKQTTIQILRDKVDDMLLVRSTRNRVYDEYYFGLFLHISWCKGKEKCSILVHYLYK